MQENLATDLTVDFESHEDYMSELSLEIGLTKKGASKEQLSRVVSAVGAYIKLLRSEAVQDWILDELRQENEMNFRYRSAEVGIDRVVDLAEKFFTASTVESLLFDPFDLSKFDRADAARLISELTVDRLQVFLLSSELQNTETFTVDPIYKTKYLAENIRSELIQAAQELRPQEKPRRG